MTQLLSPSAARRAFSRPLDAKPALQTVFQLAEDAGAKIADRAEDFEYAIGVMESLVSRWRAAFLAQTHSEADHALAYHDRAMAELDGFVPMYYRRAVMENIAERYRRSAQQMMRESA